MATGLQGLLASLLNSNPGAGGLLSDAGYLASTGLGPQQMQRYSQGAGMPTMAPAGPAQPQQAPQAPMQPDMQQTASTAPSGGGLGGLLQGIFAPKAAQKNKTVQLLMQDGLDEGTATLVAQDKGSLTAYLRQRAFGGGAQNRQTTTIDGKLIDTNTGEVLGDYGSPEDESTASMKEYEYAKKTGAFDGSFTDWQTKGIREQDPTFSREMDLRQQYDMLPEVKDYKAVKSNYERIQQGVSLGTGAGDAAIVFGYMKMLDPTSVVREGEQATTRNAAGVPEAVRGIYNQIVGGGQLSGEARNQILQAAEKVYGESAANMGELNTRYSGFATNYQLDPNRIITPIEQYDPLQILPPPGAAVPPTGRDRHGTNPATGKGDRLRSDPLGIR